MKVISRLIIVALIITKVSLYYHKDLPRFNLDRWMKELPNQLKIKPIIYLAIPGSHNSMTYGIDDTSEVGPDADDAFIKPPRWCVTQNLTAAEQLNNGIRYLDLRLATKSGTEDFYFTHGLYAGEITQGLTDVKTFVDSHPGEVVILDFHHFYSFTGADHQRLMRFLLNLYGPRLVPQTEELTDLTLKSLSQLKQSVIVVYRHYSMEETAEFWTTDMMPIPSPRQQTTSGLMKYLKKLYRPPGIAFVHQAVLTPTKTFIQSNWESNINETCAVPVMNEVLRTIALFVPGPPRANNPSPLNVIIADFIEFNHHVFAVTVINNNFKLYYSGFILPDWSYRNFDNIVLVVWFKK